MKPIRTIALGLALVAAAAGSAAGQLPQPQGQPQGQAQGGGRQGGGRMSVGPLFEGIALSAEQQAKVDSVQAAIMPRAQAAREAVRAARESGGDVQAAMKNAQAIDTERMTAVKAVLTAEQQAAFEKNREATDARRREMMQNRGGPPAI